MKNQAKVEEAKDDMSSSDQNQCESKRTRGGKKKIVLTKDEQDVLLARDEVLRKGPASPFYCRAT